jgi:hypothetical protein
MTPTRQAFEAWAEPRGYIIADYFQVSNRYPSPLTEIAWTAWQAALEAVPVEAIREAARLLSSAHVSTGETWARKEAVEALEQFIAQIGAGGE